MALSSYCRCGNFGPQSEKCNGWIHCTTTSAAIVLLLWFPTPAKCEQVTELLQYLQDVPALTAEYCVARLGEVKQEDASTLATALKNADPRIREFAATAYAKNSTLGAERQAELLLIAREDPNLQAREAALAAVLQTNLDPPIRDPLLARALSSPSDRLRKNGAESLKKLGGRFSSPASLYPLLQSGDARVKSVVLETLAQVDSLPDSKVAVPLLAPLIDHFEPAVREGAIRLLARLSPSTAVKSLKKELLTANWSRQIEILYYLTLLGDAVEEVLPEVLRLATDKESRVRQSIAEILGQLKDGRPKVMTSLLTLAQDAIPSVRISALEALAAQEGNDEKIISTLNAAANEADEGVASAAKSVRLRRLFRINPGAAQELQKQENIVPSGAEVSIRIPATQRILGENIWIDYCLKNRDARPLRYSIGGDYRMARRAARFKVTAIGPDGSAAVDPYPDTGNGGGGLGINGVQLKEGEEKCFPVDLALYVQLDRPGQYKLTVSHDFGWNESGPLKVPKASTALMLRPPTEWEARKVVEEMLTISKAPKTFLEPSRGGNFAAIRQPIYLPILAEAAFNGSAGAVSGISNIATIEATRILFDVAHAPQEDVRTAAAWALSARVPKGVSADERFRASWRHALPENVWDAELNPKARMLGLERLKGDEAVPIMQGAFLVEAFGEQTDLPIFTDAITRTLNGSKTQGALGNLVEAAKHLVERGILLSSPPSTPGEQIYFLEQLAAKKVPENLQCSPAELFSAPEVYIRLSAAKHVPDPMSPEHRDTFLKLLGDPSNEVRKAACYRLQEPGVSKVNEDLKGAAQALLSLVSSERDWMLLDCAVSVSAKFDRLGTVRALVSRLTDPEISSRIQSFLFSLVIETRAPFSIHFTKVLQAEKLEELQRRWERFISTHEGELESGKRFSTGDNQLVKQLFPNAQLN